MKCSCCLYSGYGECCLGGGWCRDDDGSCEIGLCKSLGEGSCSCRNLLGTCFEAGGSSSSSNLVVRSSSLPCSSRYLVDMADRDTPLPAGVHSNAPFQQGISSPSTSLLSFFSFTKMKRIHLYSVHTNKQIYNGRVCRGVSETQRLQTNWTEVDIVMASSLITHGVF